MSAKDWIEVTTSMVGGAGIGAALMYLLDPERGDHRREELREMAHHAVQAANVTLGAGEEALGEAWEDASGRARGWGQRISRQAQRARARLMHHAADAQSAAGDWMDDAHDRARGYGRDASNSARGYARQASKYASRAGSYLPYHEESHVGSAIGITAGVVGALALGAGIMFLFDPNQGNRRRTLVRDKATQYTNEASEAVKRGGQVARDYRQTAVRKAQQAIHPGKQNNDPANAPAPAPSMPNA